MGRAWTRLRAQIRKHLVGLVGAVIGGYLASLLDIQGTFHFWGSVIIAFIGACILVAVLQLLSGGRRRTP